MALCVCRGWALLWGRDRDVPCVGAWVAGGLPRSWAPASRNADQAPPGSSRPQLLTWNSPRTTEPPVRKQQLLPLGLSRGCLFSPEPMPAPSLGVSLGLSARAPGMCTSAGVRWPPLPRGWFQAGSLCRGSALKQSLGMYHLARSGEPHTQSSACYLSTDSWEARYVFKMVSDTRLLGILIKFLEKNLKT